MRQIIEYDPKNPTICHRYSWWAIRLHTFLWCVVTALFVSAFLVAYFNSRPALVKNQYVFMPVPRVWSRVDGRRTLEFDSLYANFERYKMMPITIVPIREK